MMDISLSSYLCIMDAQAQILVDSTITSHVAALRLSALGTLRSYLLRYLRDEQPIDLVHAVCVKKVAFILEATTANEMGAIMRPQLPQWHAGKVICRSPYHIPAEELMLWTHISPFTRLASEAIERCIEMFKQTYGVSIEDFDGRKPL